MSSPRPQIAAVCLVWFDLLLLCFLDFQCTVVLEFSVLNVLFVCLARNVQRMRHVVVYCMCNRFRLGPRSCIVCRGCRCPRVLCTNTQCTVWAGVDIIFVLENHKTDELCAGMQYACYRLQTICRFQIWRQYMQVPYLICYMYLYVLKSTV